MLVTLAANGNLPPLVGVALFIGIFAFIAVLVAAIQSYNRKRILKVLEPVAERYGGQIQMGGIFTLPKMTLDVGGAQAEVTVFPGAKNSPPNTYCTVAAGVRDQHYLHVRPSMFGDGLGKFFGMQDLEIGAPAFDEKFIIKGKDHQFVVDFLAPGLQEQLLKRHGEFVHLTLEPGRLRVGCNRFPKQPSDVEWVIESLLMARQQLKETAPDFV